MAFSIGRAGKTLLLNDPSMWAEQNGVATVTVVSTVSPATDALKLRDQLLGYVDNWDEPIVPVICDSEPRRTGYYEVLGVQIDTDPVAVALGIFTAYISLRPVMGFSQPMIEAVMSGALLTNAVGAVLADVTAWHAVPGATTEYYNPGLTASSRGPGADGTLSFWTNTAGTGLSTTARSGLTPANFYINAATFEQGATLQPIVGRVLTQPDPLNWRLSNGLVRVTSTGSPGLLLVSWYNGTSWSATTVFRISDNGGGSPINYPWTSVVVLRNSVEEVSIRLTSIQSANEIVTVDLSLRRGDRLVRLFIAASNVPRTFAVFRTAIEAGTAITYGAVTVGGVRKTTNDADGNRWVILSYQATPVNDLVNGGVKLNAAGLTMDAAIGAVVPGTAAAPDDAVSLAKQYLAAQSESQHVVPR